MQSELILRFRPEAFRLIFANDKMMTESYERDDNKMARYTI
jgi:hypothetical protein